jgi:titin
LAQGDLVVAKVQATNAFGTSTESTPSTAAALVEVVPHKPNTPVRGALTHETQIELTYDTLTGVATGGSPILSYVVTWDQGTGNYVTLAGDSTPNLATTVLFTTGISSGGSYNFKIFGRNVHGDGAESDPVTILAATVPATMNAPTISTVSAHTSLQYRVTVVAPYSGGAGVAIDAYEVVFKYSDGSGYASTAECDGSSATFKSNLYCDVSLTTFTAAPYNLVRGDEIIAKVLARNTLGDGTYSADSSSATALAVSIPADPASPPLRVEVGSTETSIVVNMPVISGASDTGGMAILSYSLEMDSGSGFTALVGAGPDSLATSYTATGLTTGSSYSFRYLVRNEVGWSANPSPTLTTYSAVAPGQISAPTTAISGYDVAFSWTAPTTGGLPITSYKVFIKSTTSTFELESASCNVAVTSCQVPLLTLQASPFSLVLGDLVQARIRAVNLVGESIDSSQNTAGALIETVPSAPPVAPLRNPLTTMSSLTVDYYALTGSAIGGTPVLSMELQWNQGDTTATWVALVGDSVDSLQTQFTVYDAGNPSLVQSGQYYSFRYRAKNRQGWGDFSGATSIIAANVPD